MLNLNSVSPRARDSITCCEPNMMVPANCSSASFSTAHPKSIKVSLPDDVFRTQKLSGRTSR